MGNDDLARVGIFQESRLAVNVEANILHITPDAREAQVEVARQNVEAVKARYETPVRITMRYLLGAILSLLMFMIVVLLLAKAVGLDMGLATVVIVVAGVAVAAPLGVVLSKLVSRVFPELPSAAGPKQE